MYVGLPLYFSPLHDVGGIGRIGVFRFGEHSSGSSYYDYVIYNQFKLGVHKFLLHPT